MDGGLHSTRSFSNLTNECFQQNNESFFFRNYLFLIHQLEREIDFHQSLLDCESDQKRIEKQRIESLRNLFIQRYMLDPGLAQFVNNDISNGEKSKSFDKAIRRRILSLYSLGLRFENNYFSTINEILRQSTNVNQYDRNPFADIRALIRRPSDDESSRLTRMICIEYLGYKQDESRALISNNDSLAIGSILFKYKWQSSNSTSAPASSPKLQRPDFDGQYSTLGQDQMKMYEADFQEFKQKHLMYPEAMLETLFYDTKTYNLLNSTNYSLANEIWTATMGIPPYNKEGDRFNRDALLVAADVWFDMVVSNDAIFLSIWNKEYWPSIDNAHARLSSNGDFNPITKLSELFEGLNFDICSDYVQTLFNYENTYNNELLIAYYGFLSNLALFRTHEAEVWLNKAKSHIENSPNPRLTRMMIKLGELTLNSVSGQLPDPENKFIELSNEISQLEKPERYEFLHHRTSFIDFLENVNIRKGKWNSLRNVNWKDYYDVITTHQLTLPSISVFTAEQYFSKFKSLRDSFQFTRARIFISILMEHYPSVHDPNRPFSNELVKLDILAKDWDQAGRDLKLCDLRNDKKRDYLTFLAEVELNKIRTTDDLSKFNEAFNALVSFPKEELEKIRIDDKTMYINRPIGWLLTIAFSQYEGNQFNKILNIMIQELKKTGVEAAWLAKYDTDAPRMLADIALGKGMPSLSIALLKLGIHEGLSPDDKFDYYYSLAYSYYVSGNYLDAIEFSERCIELKNVNWKRFIVLELKAKSHLRMFEFNKAANTIDYIRDLDRPGVKQLQDEIHLVADNQIDFSSLPVSLSTNVEKFFKTAEWLWFDIFSRHGMGEEWDVSPVLVEYGKAVEQLLDEIITRPLVESLKSNNPGIMNNYGIWKEWLYWEKCIQQNRSIYLGGWRRIGIDSKNKRDVTDFAIKFINAIESNKIDTGKIGDCCLKIADYRNSSAHSSYKSLDEAREARKNMILIINELMPILPKCVLSTDGKR